MGINFDNKKSKVSFDTIKNGIEIKNPILYQLDDTLTKQGFGADAKAVGEALKNVEVDLTGYATEDYVVNSIAQIDLTDYATKQYVDTSLAEIDLTDYATKQYVDDSIIQSDYEQQDSTAADYIKNKTHYRTYKSELSTAPEDGTLILGIKKIKDMSSYNSSLLDTMKIENLFNKKATNCYEIKMYRSFFGSIMEVAVNFNTNTTSNFEGTKNVKVLLSGAKGGVALYFIIDRASLSDSSKALFDTNGIYLECTKANQINAIKYVEVKYYIYTTISARYLPPDVLYKSDKDEIYSYIDNAISALKNGG